MELVRKGGLVNRAGINVDEATVPAKVSVLEIDRDNEVTLPQGFRHREGLRHFKTNPTVYFGHQSFGLPIGKANRIRLADDHIGAVTKMAVDVQGPIGDHVRGVFDLITQGFLNAWSIGFWFDDFVTDRDQMRELLANIGNEASGTVAKNVDNVRRIFTRNRLAEYSAVGIGSSPSSLTERGYTGTELAPEIRELLQFGAKYDVERDGDWVEWLRYTEGASIAVDAEAVVATDVECEVVDACTVDIYEIMPKAAGGDDGALLRRWAGGDIRKGESLAAFLNGQIDNMVDDDTSRADVIERMASAAGISASTVRQILNASIICPPVARLTAFATVLPASASAIIGAGNRDGCDYDANAAPPTQDKAPAPIGATLQAALDKAGVEVVWHGGAIALQVALDDDEHGAKVVVPIAGDTLAAINAKADTLAELALLEGLTAGGGE